MTKYHIRLSCYFAGKQLYLDEETRKKPNIRKLVEQPWQQTKGGLWDEVIETLCNLHYIEAKCCAGLTFLLIDDYSQALVSIPEHQLKLKEDRQRRKDIDCWVHEIIEYSGKWSDRRNSLIQGKAECDTEPILPKSPPLCRIWSQDEIDSECQRIINNPTLYDKFLAFMNFVNSQCYPLIKFCKQPGFVFQHAFNQEPAGYVYDIAKPLIHSINSACLLQNWPDETRPDLMAARLLTLFGHSKSVNCVNISPDGDLAVSASFDKTLRVWDLKNAKCLFILEGHTESIECVSITPDKRRAVSGSLDRSLRVWNLENGHCLRVLTGHENRINSVRITPDGRYAVSGSGGILGIDEKTVRVWDLENGECLYILHGHSKDLTDVSVTANGLHAISVSQDSTMRIWNILQGECNKIINEESLEFKRSIDYISRELDIVPFFNPSFWQKSASNSIGVSNDGMLAITGSFDGRVKVWDIKNGTLVKTLEGHNEAVSSISITPDGTYALSGGYDWQIRLWQIESGVCLRTISGFSAIESVSITPDGRRAISANANELIVWNIENGQSSRISPAPYSGVTDVCITKDGKLAVTVCNDWRIRVWDIEKRQCIQILKGHSAEILSVCVTPDGNYIVTSGADSTVRIWSIINSVCLRIINCKAGPITITPDGRQIVCGVQQTLQVWDIESGVRVWSYFKRDPTENLSVLSVSLSFDGKRALCGSYPDLWLWDLENKQCLLQLKGHTAEVNSVNISTDGKYAASGSDDNTVCLWDLDSGTCLRTITEHTGAVKSVCFSSNGKYVISGSYDKSLRVWDFNNGNCLAIFVSSSPIKTIAVSPVAPLVICGTYAGEVIFLELKGLDLNNPVVPVLSIPDMKTLNLKLQVIPVTDQNNESDDPDTLKNRPIITKHENDNKFILESSPVNKETNHIVICPECNSQNAIKFKKIKSNNFTLIVLLVINIGSLSLLLLNIWWLLLVIPLAVFTSIWIKAYRLLQVCSTCGHKFF